MNVIRKFINEGGKRLVFITFHGKLNLPFHISHRHFTFHKKKNVLQKQIFKFCLLTATGFRVRVTTVTLGRVSRLSETISEIVFCRVD